MANGLMSDLEAAETAADDSSILRRRPWSVAALAGSFAFAVSTFSDAIGSGRIGVDFGVFHAAGTTINQDGYDVVYDPTRFSQFFAEEYFPTFEVEGSVTFFINPPPFGWLAQALTVLPFELSLLVWSIVGLAAIVPACRVLGLPAWAPLAVAVSPMAVQTLRIGQTGLFVFVLFAFLHEAHRRENDLAAGVLAGLLILKPPLAIGYGILWLLGGRRHVRSIVVAAITGLVVSLPTLVAGLQPWRAYFGVLSERTDIESAWTGQSLSLAEFIKLLTPGASTTTTFISWGLGLALGFLVLGYAKRRFGDDPVLMSAIAALVTVIASPHLLLYDSLLLVIPVAVAWQRGVLKGERFSMLATILVVALVLGPIVFPEQIARFGRAIGLEFPALVVCAVLLGRWSFRATGGESVEELRGGESELSPATRDIGESLNRRW